MITTGKKDIVMSYLSYALRSMSNVFLVPIILKTLTNTEYGIWNIYVAIGSLVVLIDLGFSTVIQRYVIYSYCGAENIPENGVPKISNHSEPNYVLLFDVFGVAKNIYRKMCIIASAAILLLSIYIIYINNGQIAINTLLSSWYIYGFSICVQIYYISYNCMIKGMGKYKEISTFQMIQQILYLFLAFVFLLLGQGLLAIAAANCISSVLYRMLVKGHIDRFLAKYADYTGAKKTIPEEKSELYKTIQKNTKGLFMATISVYISSYGATIICSAFLPLGEIGSLGLTNQIVGIVSTIASTPFSSYMSKMGDLRVNLKWEELKNIFSKVTCFYSVIFLLGGSAILLLGEWALQLYGANTQLLPFPSTFVIIITSYITGNHQRCTNFLMLGNKQMHVKAYFLSSITTIALSTLTLTIWDTVFCYVLIALLIQVCYNAWKWPYEVYKELRLSIWDQLKRAIK